MDPIAALQGDSTPGLEPGGDLPLHTLKKPLFQFLLDFLHYRRADCPAIFVVIKKSPDSG